MKPIFLSGILLLLCSSTWAQTEKVEKSVVAAQVEEVISTIDRYCAQIEADSTYKQSSRERERGMGRGTRIASFSRGKDTVMIGIADFMPQGKYVERYYLAYGHTIKVEREETFYSTSAFYNDAQNKNEGARVEKNTYYLQNDEVIRWVDDKGKVRKSFDEKRLKREFDIQLKNAQNELLSDL